MMVVGPDESGQRRSTVSFARNRTESHQETTVSRSLQQSLRQQTEQSRGEKRKRKLQILQQLLRDESTEPQSGLSAESASDPRSRSISAEYDLQIPYPNALTAAASSCLESPLSQVRQTPGQTIALPERTATECFPPVASVPSNFSPAWPAPLLQLQPQSPPATWNVPQWMFTEPEAAPPELNLPAYQISNHIASYHQHFTPAVSEYVAYDACQLPSYNTPQTAHSSVYQGAGAGYEDDSSVSLPISFSQNDEYYDFF